jgi:hypothetical protein
MNLALRTKILKKSLEVEHQLNEIIISLINVKSTNPKTLGHKSSAFSFSNKVNLLYDLELIDNPEYNLLFCFMEIRNQFMHNLDADNFTVVINRINKTKLFLSISPEINSMLKSPVDGMNVENLYELIFDKLVIELGGILVKLHEIIKNNLELEIEQRKSKHIINTQEKMSVLMDESIKEACEKFEERIDEAFNRKTEFGNLMQVSILSLFNEKIKKEFNVENIEK